MSARPLPADNPGTPPASDEDGDHEGSDEEQSAEEEITKTKKPRENMKNVWLLTYGASSPYITPGMLETIDPDLKIKECHSTKDSAMAVTYLYLTKRVRKSNIEIFMKVAHTEHGIVQNPVSGHESIACSPNATPIQEHIGFKLLLKHYIAKDPAFKPWTDKEPVLKRGLIFEAATDKPKTQPHHARKTSVSMDKEQLKAEVTELSTLRTKNAAEISTLRTENAALKRRIQELEGLDAVRTDVAALKTENAALKRRNQELEGLDAVRTEVAALKRDFQEFKRAQHD